MTADQHELALQINERFDRLVECKKGAGAPVALQDASASAFAAIEFIQQNAGRIEALKLIDDLIDA